jgi:hypothetical protein
VISSSSLIGVISVETQEKGSMLHIEGGISLTVNEKKHRREMYRNRTLPLE